MYFYDQNIDLKPRADFQQYIAFSGRYISPAIAFFGIFHSYFHSQLTVMTATSDPRTYAYDASAQE